MNNRSLLLVPGQFWSCLSKSIHANFSLCCLYVSDEKVTSLLYESQLSINGWAWLLVSLVGENKSHLVQVQVRDVDWKRVDQLILHSSYTTVLWWKRKISSSSKRGRKSLWNTLRMREKKIEWTRLKTVSRMFQDWLNCFSHQELKLMLERILCSSLTTNSFLCVHVTLDLVTSEEDRKAAFEQRSREQNNLRNKISCFSLSLLLFFYIISFYFYFSFLAISHSTIHWWSLILLL